MTPQTLGNFNGKVLLSEILAKHYILDFQTWICKPFVVHDTTVCSPRHETMLYGDLCDHGYCTANEVVARIIALYKN